MIIITIIMIIATNAKSTNNIKRADPGVKRVADVLPAREKRARDMLRLSVSTLR